MLTSNENEKKKKNTINACNPMDAFKKHFAEWKKQDVKKSVDGIVMHHGRR